MSIRYYEGQRLFLRPIEPEDEPLLRRWINDPECWRTLGRFRPVNRPREREYIEGLYRQPDEVAFGIVVRESERLIGVAGLRCSDPANRAAEFGILIGEAAFRSRGYGTEATRLVARYGFDELNLNRIGLSVCGDNRRAVRAYRRAGFREEGRRREAYFRNGRYHDELCFGLLRREWSQPSSSTASQAGDKDEESAPLASMTTWSTSLMT